MNLIMNIPHMRCPEKSGHIDPDFLVKNILNISTKFPFGDYKDERGADKTPRNRDVEIVIEKYE